MATKLDYKLRAQRVLAQIAPGGVGAAQDKVECEVPHLRGRNHKTFRCSDGTYMRVIHARPLHYQEGTKGPWQDLDLTWRPTEREGFAWEMMGAGYKAWIADSLDADPLFRVEVQDRVFELRAGAVEKWTYNLDGSTTVVKLLNETTWQGIMMPDPDGDRFVIHLTSPVQVTISLIAGPRRLRVEIESSAIATPDVSSRIVLPLVETGIMLQQITEETYYASYDGYAWGNHATYLTARANNDSYDFSGTYFDVGQTTGYWVIRGYIMFDTSGIPPYSGILTQELHLCAHTDFSSTDFLIQVCGAQWTSPFSSAPEQNYDAGLSGEVSTFRNTSSGWVATTWYDAAIPTVSINPTGNTCLILVSDQDRAASVPTNAEYVRIYSSESSYDPYIVITYEPHPNKSYSPCHALGARLLPYVYDREDNLLQDPGALMDIAQDQKYSSTSSGGFFSASLRIPIGIRRALSAKHAYRLAWRLGMETVWDGRISDIIRRSGDGGWATIEAFGLAEHLRQLRLTLTAESGETARDIALQVFNASPLISRNYIHVNDPEFDLGGMEWTRAPLQDILKDLCTSGDVQDPPRIWYYHIWQSEAKPVDGSDTVDVAASADDAHDRNDDGDNTYTETVIRVGYGGGGSYVAGIIFNVSIPRYANITSATLTLTSQGYIGEDDLHADIYGELSANPSDFSISWPSERARTAHSAYWLDEGWPAAGNPVTTVPDLTEVVQELVNQPDWTENSKICILIVDLDTAGGVDSRKQIESYDNAGTDEPRLEVHWGATAEMVQTYHPEYVPRPVIDRFTADYLVSASEQVGDLALIHSTEKIENAVTAQYGSGPSYTSEATDTDSIDRLDKRQNDPTALNAGETATQTQAEKLRDTHLERYHDVLTKAEGIKLSVLRDPGGHPVHPGSVHASCVIRFIDLPTFDPDADNCYYIVEASYEHESRTVTIVPDAPPDVLEQLIASFENE